MVSLSCIDQKLKIGVHTNQEQTDGHRDVVGQTNQIDMFSISWTYD